MAKRWVAGAIALFAGVNGVIMLVFGAEWYRSVPGVSETGPYNGHFVADVGAAFLAAGAGMALRAWRRALWPAGLAGAAFIGLHGLIHLAAVICGADPHAAFDAVVVIFPAALAMWAALPGLKEERSMLNFVTDQALKAFGARYDYDVSYMRHMLRAAPRAFSKFAKVTNIAAHREAAPVDAWYAAKIVGTLAEDCGPCAQLVVKMAEEAGVASGQIEAVLTRNVSAMSDDVALAFRFADAVARRTGEDEALREEIRRRWGEAGLIDLALAMQAGRLFPMVKGALGYAKTCQRVSVGDRMVAVVKEAA